MELIKQIIKTDVARSGMTFADALRECVDKGVSGIPYVDDQGRVIGRFSLRNAFLQLSIPKDMVKGAHLLGDLDTHTSIVDLRVGDLLERPIDEMILNNIVCLSPNSPVIKALALMEKFNSSYLFLMEKDQYLGVITRPGIARLVLEGSREKTDGS